MIQTGRIVSKLYFDENVYLNLWERFIGNSGSHIFTHFVQSEPRGKVGSFFDITEISMVVSLAYFKNLAIY